jgi:CRP-like cAMP-binding protein
MPLSINVVRFLENAEFFSGLSTQNRALLADHCILKEQKKGEVLFREGDPGLALWFLVHGNIQLSKSTDDGRSVILRVMKDGEMFGEVVLFEKSRYPVTATAIRKSLSLMLPRQAFSDILADEKFRIDFLAGMMNKMRYLAEKIKYLSLHDVEDRFRIFLMEQYGRKASIKPTVSKKSIAAAIATTPETLSRLLARLNGEGLLTWQGATIRATDAFWKSAPGSPRY